ncbi:phycobiliprotein lyase [Acaryochloris sp. IP29b_bin.148]|uniref:phycobiliprotein lyase n=1 Tax=Acaryochloris sp. IP29b_bin.148 TaxID=2969218 RepID=UPI002632109C|nr:phycobiliprotein lyase [Acaryochloris sp. IP29b_bin.148]
MNIQGFIQLSCGRWFTQRTCHPLGGMTSEAQAAQLEISSLKEDELEVVNLCKTAGFDPKLALCAARLSWQSQGFSSQPQENGTLLMVPMASNASEQQGQLLQQGADGAVRQLNFHIDADQRLILTGVHDQRVLEEQIWFASPNLRLRISILKQVGQLVQATWYSEVRMGEVATPASDKRVTSVSTP